MCVDCYVSCKWLRVIWFSTSTFPVLLSPPIGGGDRSGDATTAKGTTPNQCVILQSVYWYCIIYSFSASPWLYIVHTLVYQATIQKASAFYFGLSLICAVAIAHFPGQSSFPVATVFILSSASHILQYFPFLVLWFFDSVDAVQGSLLPIGWWLNRPTFCYSILFVVTLWRLFVRVRLLFFIVIVVG